jgi:DNA-binding NtrC family response regulator
MKVLIVDDDPEIHHEIRLILNDSSWTIESAANFDDALVRLQSQPYDVVMTDIPASDPDGFAFLSQIAAIRLQTKVLVISAGNRPDRVAGSMRGRAACYVSKPFTAEQLKGALTEMLVPRIEPDDIEVLSDKPNWVTRQSALQAGDR